MWPLIVRERKAVECSGASAFLLKWHCQTPLRDNVDFDGKTIPRAPV